LQGGPFWSVVCYVFFLCVNIRSRVGIKIFEILFQFIKEINSRFFISTCSLLELQVLLTNTCSVFLKCFFNLDTCTASLYCFRKRCKEFVHRPYSHFFLFQETRHNGRSDLIPCTLDHLDRSIPVQVSLHVSDAVLHGCVFNLNISMENTTSPLLCNVPFISNTLIGLHIFAKKNDKTDFEYFHFSPPETFIRINFISADQPLIVHTPSLDRKNVWGKYIITLHKTQVTYTFPTVIFLSNYFNNRSFFFNKIIRPFIAFQ